MHTACMMMMTFFNVPTLLILLTLCSIAVPNHSLTLPRTGRKSGIIPISDPVMSPSEPECPSSCRFLFCEGASDKILMSVAGVPLTNAICIHKFASLASSRAGEARYHLPTGRNVRISSLYLKGPPQTLGVAMPSTLLKTFTVPGREDRNYTAVGHNKLSCLQRAALNGLCLHVPIVDYTFRGFPGGPVKQKLGKSFRTPRHDCISLKMVRPKLDIRLRWATNDDFDLEVVEPDGSTLYYLTRRTDAGVFITDGNAGDCESNRDRGTEAIAYHPAPLFKDGDYLIRVHRFEKCSDPAVLVPFTVIVLLDGKEWIRHRVTTEGEERDGLIPAAFVRMTFTENATVHSYALSEDARDGDGTHSF